MKKKIISAICVFAIALSQLVAVSAAEDELVVKYSTGNGDYYNITEFADNQTAYTVNLLSGAKYAYIKFSAPSGCTAPDSVLVYNKIRGAEDSNLVGTDGNMSTNSFLQSKVEVDALKDGDAFIIPIKNEYAEAKFSYKDEKGTKREYSVAFVSKQARLTEFTDNTSSSDGKVIFVSGAAANNDNGTIIETGVKGNPLTVRALGNISEKLVGASMFMLPALTNADKSVSKTLFSFKADRGGDIYVLSNGTFDGGSVYKTGADGWTCVNDGEVADGITVGGTAGQALSTSRAYNAYTNVDYFAWSIKWWVRPFTNEREDYNLYRTENPGVDGNTTVDDSDPDSASTAGACALSNAYAKAFEKGELVEVKGFGHNSQDTAIFVVWKDEPFEVTYSVDGSNFNKISEIAGSVTEAQVNLPDNTDAAFVKFENADATDVYASWQLQNYADNGVGALKTQISLNAQRNSKGIYTIPVKNGTGYLEFKYKSKNYKIEFKSNQGITEAFDSDNVYNFELEKTTENAYVKLVVPSGTSASVKTASGMAAELEDGRYKIPIDGASGTAVITHTAGGVTTKYTVNFEGPKAASLKITMKYAADIALTFLDGERIKNDNQPFYIEEDAFERTEMTLIDVPIELNKSSIFMMPLDELKSSNSWSQDHLDEDMFTFVPTAPGTVYVLTDVVPVLNSEYELLWDVKNISATLETKVKDIQSGKIITNESISLTKAYSYAFSKNEEVGVPVPESDSWKGNIAVIIKWDEN